MAKLTLSDLASLTNQTSAIATINANNALIETALENTLSRDGTSPNAMGATLDMNSNRIINLPEPVADQEPVRKGEFDELVDEVDAIILESTVAGLASHINDTIDAHDASAISVVPTGDLGSTDVQSALEELQADIDADEAALAAHIADTTDAHAASAITNTPAGNISATTVQAAINELDTEKQPLDSDLTAIAALSPTNDDIIQRKAGAWTNRTMAQLIADLGALGTTFQPLDSDLTSWAGITRASGFDTFVATPSSANLRSLLTDETGTGVLYFQGGDAGTPSAINLTNGTALPVSGITSSISTALGVGSIELGHATDTTIARSTAGNVTIEGNIIYRAGGTDVPITDGGTGASDAATAFSNLKQAASTLDTGVVELATAAETTAGTDTTRAITPDALNDSDFGKTVIGILVFNDSTNVATGNGAGDVFIRIPATLNGANLVAVAAMVDAAGTTGTTDIQIANVTQAADMLTTKMTIDSGETDTLTAATPAVIDTANDDVATGDKIRIDVDAVSTTPPTGLFVELTFQKP